jgi:hypothetical protein
VLAPRLKHWLCNLTLLALSVAFTLMALEHVVFRYILQPDDLLENVSINSVVRYMPGTRANFRHPDGRTTRVTINSDGWNSLKPEYKVARTPGVTRIAVVGDSYVHGAFVDVGEAFPELMEKDLRAAGHDVEVYRFGMDGAPLSQYLHVVRREVLAYRPDIVVIPLIHNDFDESYRFLKTRYASSFMKLRKAADGSVEEVQPADFRYGLADTLRNWRTFRYLYYKTNLYLYAKSWVSRLFWGGNEDWSPEFISSAVDIRKIRDHASNRFFTHYVMAELKTLSIERNFKLAFVMDGVREAVYAGRPVADYEAGELNLIAAEIAADLDLPFLDLQATFARDYAINHRRFEYPYDWHWNVHANRLVAGAVERLLLTDPRLSLGRPRRSASVGP